MSELPITILILNWNGLKDTIACVDALLAGELNNARIAVVDNGSEGSDFDQLQRKYESQSAVAISHNDTNLGFTKGVNQFVREQLEHANHGWLVLLNNDAIVEPDWLSSLLRCAKDHAADMVASCMIRYEDRDRLDNAGHMMLNTGEILPRGVDDHPAQFEQPQEVLGACAGAALYSLAMLGDIGLFDEYFDTGYEDAELGLRAVLAGYKIVYEPRAVVYHHVSRSLDKIRNFNYAVGIQRNINYTMFKLLPWQLLVLNAPFIVIKQLCLLVTAIVTLRGRLLRAHTKAIWESARSWRVMLAARRRSQRLRRIYWAVLLRRQRFFLPTYWQYFVRYIIGREPTVFERY